MTVKKLTPYLFFDGDAAKVIQFYEQTLEADVEGLLHWGEHPESCPEGMKGRVMHALLHIGQASLMVSDSPTRTPAPSDRGVSLAIEVDEVDQMTRYFDALAKDGAVIEKIHDAFWGDKFGIVRDAFGIVWMFTCPTRKEVTA